MKLEQYERFTDTKNGSVLQRPVLITSISENTARVKSIYKNGLRWIFRCNADYF